MRARYVIGSYDSILKTCYVRKAPVDGVLKTYRCLSGPDPAVAAYLSQSTAVAAYGYAALLVHEATHGLLLKHRFPAKNVRVERLCQLEEMRFLSRFPRFRGDALRAAERPATWICLAPRWQSRAS